MLRRILQSKWLTGALALVVSLVALSVLRIWPLVVTINKETMNLQQKIDEANRNLAELEKSKEYFKNPAYLERQARIKLNFKKPDEKVVFVYKNPYNQSPDELAQTLADRSRGFWQKLWDYLLGK